MRKLSFENPEMIDILNHQVIHMDQGVSYNPEYLATRKMRYYPSRVSQIIRSVLTKEIEPTAYGAELVCTPMLSGQGERWQNFGENPNGYLITLALGRELFREAGLMEESVDPDEGSETVDVQKLEKWERFLPVDPEAQYALFLDPETFSMGTKRAMEIGEFLEDKGIDIQPEFGPFETGFDLFANGRIDEAAAVIEERLREFEQMGVTRVITLTGQAQYTFTTLASLLGIESDLEFVHILEMADDLLASRAYIYGGSFLTRYLGMTGLLNELTHSHDEVRISAAPEFLPEVEGSARRNIVGIWTPPICPEYHPVGADREVHEKIYEQSLKTIENTSFDRILVCDPFAWQALIDHGYPQEKLVYFTSALV